VKETNPAVDAVGITWQWLAKTFPLSHNLRFRHVLFEAVRRHDRLVVLAVGFAELQKSADFSDNINQRDQ